MQVSLHRVSARRQEMAASARLNPEQLHQYFDRICLRPEIAERMDSHELDIETLTAICNAHAERIPFENLDLVCPL